MSHNHTTNSMADMDCRSMPARKLCPLPLELLHCVIDFLPCNDLLNCLTVNTVFFHCVVERLYDTIKVFNGGLIPLDHKYASLLDHPRMLHIFPHTVVECKREWARWHKGQFTIHANGIRVLYDQEAHIYGSGTVVAKVVSKPGSGNGRLQAAIERIVSKDRSKQRGDIPYHPCKLLDNIHARVVVYRNAVLDIASPPDLEFDLSSKTELVLPPTGAREILQVLLPSPLLPVPTGQVGGLQILSSIANIPLPTVTNLVFIFWTPGPGVKWPQHGNARASEFWLYVWPLFQALGQRFVNLTFVNAEALQDPPSGPCGCQTPYVCHGLAPCAKGLICGPHYDSFCENSLSRIRYVSMTEFLAHSRWKFIFDGHEIAGWLEAMDKDAAEKTKTEDENATAETVDLGTSHCHNHIHNHADGHDGHTHHDHNESSDDDWESTND